MGGIVAIVAIVVAFIVNLWGMNDFIRQFLNDWNWRRGR